MLPAGDNPQRRAAFASMGQGRRMAFPMHGRGGIARRNRQIIYGAGTGVAALGLIASRRIFPRSVFQAKGFIMSPQMEGKILRAGVGDALRIRKRVGVRRGLRTIGQEWDLKRPAHEYIHAADRNANTHQAFVYDRPPRSWVGEQETGFLENPLTGGLGRRLIGGEEGKVLGVPPLTRYLVPRIARARRAIGSRLEAVRLRTEGFENALSRLEEDAVRVARRQVRRGVSYVTEPRPPKKEIRAMRRVIRGEDRLFAGKIRRAVLRERGVLTEGGINFSAPFRRNPKFRPELKEALAEAKRAESKYLTREAINRLSSKYPPLTRRAAERIVNPFERGIERLNRAANDRAIRLGRLLKLPIDDALAERATRKARP